MTEGTHPQTRACEEADRTYASHTLAQAFQDDPVMQFIFPDPQTRRNRLPGVFTLLFDADGIDGARYTAVEGQAVTLWQAPGAPGFTWREKLRDVLPWWRATGTGLLRALAYSDASDANRPAAPHWYLHVAGCAPAFQSKGYGRAAIAAGLDRADADGVATYLETSNPKNLGYYAALGFSVTHEWRVRRTFVSWSMLRAPVGKAGGSAPWTPAKAGPWMPLIRVGKTGATRVHATDTCGPCSSYPNKQVLRTSP